MGDLCPSRYQWTTTPIGHANWGGFELECKTSGWLEKADNKRDGACEGMTAFLLLTC